MSALFAVLSAHAGAIGLLFFFVFFVVMLFWVFRPNAKSTYQACASIPLKENEE